jgi:hypothetical protein
VEGACLPGTPRDLSRKALEVEHLCLYRGSVRVTWRKRPCAEDSERCVTVGFGNGVFLL